MRKAKKKRYASSVNRTRASSMATTNSTTRPMMLGTVGDWIVDWLLICKGSTFEFMKTPNCLTTVDKDLCRNSARLPSHSWTGHVILPTLVRLSAVKLRSSILRLATMSPAFAAFCSQDENDVDNLETKNATNHFKHVSETKENLVKRRLQMGISVVGAFNQLHSLRL